MKKYHSRKNESGVILMASTMGIFIILSIFAFYLARFAVTETMTGGYYVLDIKARNLALTGLERGIQTFKSSRGTSTLTGNFNTGNYSVSFDTLLTESGSSLPYTNYVMMKSKSTINDVERNLRVILSSMPEAFSFSYYGNNFGGATFNEDEGTISGDMFHNGNISTSIVSTGTKYTSSGTGGTQLSSPPTFPIVNTNLYDGLIATASSSPIPSFSEISYQTLNLSSYSNSTLYHNSDLVIKDATINGPGYIVVNGDVEISSNAVINKNVFIICDGLFKTSSCQMGSTIRKSVIVYATGKVEIDDNTTFYGTLLSMGSEFKIDNASFNGALYCLGPSVYIDGSSTLVGSVVSKYSIDLNGTSSVSKGNLPPFFGLDIGLNPFVVPGSYLEY